MEPKYELLSECIICLESNDTNNSLIHLNTYPQQCSCDSYIHAKCLNDWYKYHRICPICRTPIDIPSPTLTNHTNNNRQLNTFIECCNNCIKTVFVKCICYILMLSIILYMLNDKRINNQKQF